MIKVQDENHIEKASTSISSSELKDFFHRYAEHKLSRLRLKNERMAAAELPDAIVEGPNFKFAMETHES
ncbi:hypothetical protein HHK36_031323 [Tetracentron sinense]|uniref:Uncharacterized protein n=1 Tax=Tetracentron sinense TaxID=13715 RepID=A0A834YEH9_TETSI|nr:hypothetical protein HHK36_031323 [Tetracentron sinense]